MSLKVALSISVVVGAVWGMLPSAVAEAQPTPTEIAVARGLYAEAVAYENDGNWKAAEARLRRVLSLKEAPGIYFHLAYCLENQGRLVEAMLNYDRARELVDSGVQAEDVRRLLAPRYRELVERVPTLVVRLPAGVKATRFTLDGEDIDVQLLGSAVPIDPGQHRLRIKATGYALYVHGFRVSEGGTHEARVVLQPTKTLGGAVGVPQADEEDKPSEFSGAQGVTCSSTVEKSARDASGSWKKLAPGATKSRAEAGSAQNQHFGKTTPSGSGDHRGGPVQVAGSAFGLGIALAVGAVASAGSGAYALISANGVGDDATTLARDCAAGSFTACEAHDDAVSERDTRRVVGFSLLGAAVGLGALATWQLWPSPTPSESGWMVHYATRF